MKRIKTKASIIGLAWLLVVGTGCSDQKPNAETPKNTDASVQEAVQSPHTAAERETDTSTGTDSFQEGVMIDVSAYKNEQQYEALLQTLENNMKAMVKKDAAAFEKTFLSPKEFESNRFFLDTQDQYQFVGKPTITEQEDIDRIDVGVRLRSKVNGPEMDEDIKETGIMYNFKKNASGKWKIVLID